MQLENPPAFVSSGNKTLLEEIPALNHLDKEGALPEGAYFRLGDSTKPSCRVAIALEPLQMRKSLKHGAYSCHDLVESIHRLIDNGLTSFQLDVSENREYQDWAEEQVIGLLHQNTPLSVSDACHFSIPCEVQLHDVESKPFERGTVRNSILSSLHRIGRESIDNLHLHSFSNDNCYLFDYLDICRDLESDGLLQSVSCHGISPNTGRRALDFGLDFNSVHLSWNLMDPSAYFQHAAAFADIQKPIIAHNPLAHDLLSKSLQHRVEEPHQWEWKLPQRRIWNTAAVTWARRVDANGNKDSWHLYKEMLNDLTFLARSYDVPLSSLIIRWMLQQPVIGGCSVPVSVGSDMDLDEKLQSIRDVFRFRLNSDEVARIWELSGYEMAAEETTASGSVQQTQSGLFLPT